MMLESSLRTSKCVSICVNDFFIDFISFCICSTFLLLDLDLLDLELFLLDLDLSSLSSSFLGHLHDGCPFSPQLWHSLFYDVIFGAGVRPKAFRSIGCNQIAL